MQTRPTVSNIGVAMFTVADQDAALTFHTQNGAQPADGVAAPPNRNIGLEGGAVVAAARRLAAARPGAAPRDPGQVG